MLNLLRAVSVDQLLYMVRGYHTYSDIRNPLENGLGQYIGDTALTTSMQLLSYHDGHVIRYLPKGISCSFTTEAPLLHSGTCSLTTNTPSTADSTDLLY